MELISHSECCDSSSAERSLVNMYGGVAYDHDSMPKVVAVHTLSPERLNTLEVGQRSSIMDGLPRNMIGIRIKPKGDLRSFADLKEQGELAKIVSWSISLFVLFINYHGSYMYFSSFGLPCQWNC